VSIDAATRRWIKSTADELAVRNGCRFNERLADHVVEFFPRFLCHSKGEWGGKPFELFDWQRDEIIKPIFGWIRPDGTRRFRKTYIELPKKNGKSTLAAGIGLYLLVGDNEPGAEVYSAANDREQASIVHNEAVNMTEASPELSSVLKVNQSTRTISFGAMKSFYKSVSSDAAGKEGFNAHGIICDELHIWKGRKLWDAFKYAFRARRQGLLFVITTAGDDTDSICYEQHDYARGVLAGSIQDDRFFALIKAAESEDDWTVEATWRKANPGLGQTVKLDEFAADVNEAKKTPTAQATFKRYSLNIWCTGTSPWLAHEQWAANAETYSENDLLGRECDAGLDLAKTRDMSALVLNFPPDEVGGPHRLLPFFWLPEDAAYDSDAPPELKVWAESGLLTLTPGNVCDYEFIEKQLGILSERFSIRQLAFDPWNAEHLTQRIVDHYAVKRVEFRQTIGNYAAPCSEFERAVINGTLKHNNHPILNWQAGHVTIKNDASGNMRPIKPPHQDRKKIDGIVAAIMAFALSMQQPSPAPLMVTL
jgi:phage terminase large subunit-like protein